MKTDELLNEWMDFTKPYTASEERTQRIFDKLLKRYSTSARHYHNLNHIENMLKDIKGYYGDNLNPELFFAVWFHDAVYNPLLSNNEKRSAALATAELKEMGVPAKIISKTELLIRQTANHTEADAADEDTKLFLDADMKILGVSGDEYANYIRSIHKEFSKVPDLLFKIGRKKFLKKILAAKRIYRTEKIFQQCEDQARKNLLAELNQLS